MRSTILGLVALLAFQGQQTVWTTISDPEASLIEASPYDQFPTSSTTKSAPLDQPPTGSTPTHLARHLAFQRIDSRAPLGFTRKGCGWQQQDIAQVDQNSCGMAAPLLTMALNYKKHINYYICDPTKQQKGERHIRLPGRQGQQPRCFKVRVSDTADFDVN